MKKYPLISIIVPVYNVERYLPECLESLINQTYPNLEIILVDDGSTDNCPRILDSYKKRDNRIKVIHKVNGGSVSARSVGLCVARGDFITFVDPDDYVDNDFVAYLFNLKNDYKCDISVCGPYGQYSKYLFYNKPFVCNPERAIIVIFTDKFFAGYLWNKLYSKKVFDHIKFSEQDMFEDLFTQTEIFPKVNKIVFSSQKKYHYRIINDSISHKKFNKDKLFYFEIVDKIRKLSVRNNWKNLYDNLIVFAIIGASRNIIHIILSNQINSVMLADMKNRLKRETILFFRTDGRFFIRVFLLLAAIFNMLMADIYKVIRIVCKNNV